MSDKKVAIVGAGYWGKNLVRVFNELNALHTVCDMDLNILNSLNEKYSDVTTTANYSDVLKNESITAIAIATPAESHAHFVELAILAGKDVYVEKPFCLFAKEGRHLTRLAQEHQKILMVGHILWYHPAILELQRLILNGTIGKIQYIYSNRLNIGKLRREENVLWSFAPHDISVILGLTNEMPESVWAQGSNLLHQKIADTTITILNFPSGLKAHIFVSWLHPFKEQKLIVVGDRQMAVFDDNASWEEKLILYPHTIQWNGNIPVANKAKATSVLLTESEPLKCECTHFLECIETRITPRTDGEEGLRVINVLNACQVSLEQDHVVTGSVFVDEENDYFVHETAIIDSNVEIGEACKIWHFSHLMSGTKLGKKCNIGQNVVIGPNVLIGDGCKIQNNVSAYEGVIFEDNVFCGPSVVFTNVRNPRCEIVRTHEFKKTLVKRGASIGANATIVCGVTIGQYAFIGAGAVVTSDVPNYGLVMGNPAKQVGWISRWGERLDLPLSGRKEIVCPHTGELYQLFDKILSITIHGGIKRQ